MNTLRRPRRKSVLLHHNLCYVSTFCAGDFSLKWICFFILGMTSWVLTAERQIKRIRIQFFQSVMRQSIGWFDVTEAGEINTRMVECVINLQCNPRRCPAHSFRIWDSVNRVYIINLADRVGPWSTVEPEQWSWVSECLCHQLSAVTGSSCSLFKAYHYHAIM